MKARSLPFLVGLTIIVCQSCNTNATPRPAPPPGSWLVLLCKASDDATEPQDTASVRAAFSRSAPDLLYAYFNAMSDGALDVSGSEVFGWFTMPVTTAQLAPSVRNQSMPVTRSQTARDCRNAALPALTNSGQIVDPANYMGVITVINVPADVGAATNKSVVATSHFANDMSFIAHEMLHVLSLPHSFRTSPDSTPPDHRWSHGGDLERNDCWDIMSYATCAYTFTTSRGENGPELQAAYREKLGWLPASRIYEHSAYIAGPRTITLAPLSEPAQAGYLLAKVEVPGRGRYVVEYRKNTRFDQGLLQNVVLIREQRTNNATYIVERADSGLMEWRQGEKFMDAGNYTSINIDRIGATGATVTIRTDFTPSNVGVNSMCGDKFRGAVLQCPSGSTCNPRRLGPQAVTVDYYCQVP